MLKSLTHLGLNSEVKNNMKIGLLFILVGTLSLNGTFAQEKSLAESDTPILEGAYLGQKPPGLTPEVFAPGIVSLDDHYEGSLVFSPDMDELFFQRRKVEESHNIYTMKLVNGRWSMPELATFSRKKEFLDLHPRFSSDGARLYFGSTRPLPDSISSSGLHQWYIEKNQNGWGQPKLLLKELFEDEWIMCVTPAQNGNLYFTSKEKEDKLEDEGIYYAINQEGHYGDIESMGNVINGDGKWIAHPFAASNESYIIYDAERASGEDNGDLYVSFNQNGVWSESYSLGPEINTELGQGAATVSPDGEYLFFSSVQEGDETSTMYWVSTAVIDQLRPAESTSYEIAYSSKESGDVEIYLTDVQSRSKTKITDHPGNDGYAAWSPDGKRIASYAYHDGRKTWSIHTMNIDGTDRKRLTHAKKKWDSAPAWSPNGNKIAFGRGYQDSLGIWQEEIWVMNADGSEETQIVALNGGGPCFMPDGKIVYHSKSNTSEIYVADTDGSNIIQLTDNNAEDWHPEVSPDGKQIAFMSNRDGNHEIYVMSIDGSKQKRLTFNNVRDSNPSWSPDGDRLIYTSENEDEYFDLYMMNKDGSAVEQFIPNASGAAWLKKTKLQ